MRRLKKFFALLLSVSMIMSTVNLTVLANALAGTADTDGYELLIASDSNADEKDCTYETATDSNCKATDSNCETVIVVTEQIAVQAVAASMYSTNTGSDAEAVGELASKTSELVARKDDRYKITLSVPGADTPEVHDEVIVMVDGSYSGDDEWPSTRRAILEIGESVLNGVGNTQLTLMTFGMGDNIVVEKIKSVDELDAQLTELPGGLLYGRSSTNCEAGFTGIQKYIEESDELNSAYVIYITDGEINTDETPRAFDTNWKMYSTKFGAKTVAAAAFENAIVNGKNLPDAFIAVFGDRFDGATKEEILNGAFYNGEVTEEEFFAFTDQIWADVYEYSGLTPGDEYPVSVVERAFVKYDKEHDVYVQDAFYYSTYKSSYVTYGDRWTRTPQAATELAAMDEVVHLYMVDTNGATSWMNPKNSDDETKNVVGENVTFTYNAYTNGLTESLSSALSEIAKTQYNDVVVTDYMSKWVNLDQATIQIIDETTGKAIYNSRKGWLISKDERPTDEEVPVVIELVDAEDYEDGGSEVDGNESGDIYKLTWYVKDGGLLRSDNYYLEYEVTVDAAEPGFVYGKDYPANGDTTVTYTDSEGEPQEEEIEVPDVNTEEPEPATATKTDELIDRDTNKYKVAITVPGADGEEIHDEVILMVDGSYSLDDEWPAMKEAIIGMADALLNGNGNTQLTLMAFGMGDNVVVEHVKSAGEIAAVLGELPGTLLYGRSSTNCEAGLTGVGEYIDAHDDSLNDVYVIYITDGNINTDETPYDFYQWKNYTWLKRDIRTLLSWSVEEELGYMADAGTVASDALTTVFGSEVSYENFDFDAATDEQYIQWADLVWEAVYSEAGLAAGEKYPVSDVERAFVSYDKAHNTHIQEAWYYTLWGRSYPDRWTRTPAAANMLAAKEEVNGLYFVDYSGYTEWMDTGVTARNSEYVQANGIGDILTAMEDMITDLALMPYQNVVITDYMSKWVNLDTTTIKVVDDKTGTEIYNSVDGWLIAEDRPTIKEVPVVVERVDSNEYAAGGNDVVGNTSGDIYKLTWYVKDGALLRSDSYHLEYEVTVDTEEEGFSYEVAYPANGNTNMEYTDENGIDHNEPIEVPNVDVPKTEPDPETPSESQPSESQPSESQPSESQPSESQPSESQPSESQPSESQPSENQPAESLPDDEPDGVSGRVLGATDEKDTDAETEEIIGAVLGAYDVIEIPDGMIPLGALPKTGDVSLIWVVLSILSALGLAGTSMIERKKRK